MNRNELHKEYLNTPLRNDMIFYMNNNGKIANHIKPIV